MKRLNVLYLALTFVITITFSKQAIALSTTPDKPNTASVSFGAELSSGKYGTDTTTRTVYMPLIATWSPNDRFDIGIEVPFIYQSSSNVTTTLFGASQSSAAAKTVTRGGPGGNSTVIQQQSSGNSASSGSSNSSVSGLGDIISRFGVIVFPESDKIPQVRSSIFVKFPSASKADGLGTGEFDAGAGFDITKWFGNLHLTGEALYTWQGKADGFGLKNYISYTGGVGYQLTENIEPMIIVKGATAPSTFSGDLLEARARVVWSLTDTTALDMFGSKGVADSSPDFGGGLSVIYSF